MAQLGRAPRSGVTPTKQQTFASLFVLFVFLLSFFLRYSFLSTAGATNHRTLPFPPSSSQDRFRSSNDLWLVARVTASALPRQVTTRLCFHASLLHQDLLFYNRISLRAALNRRRWLVSRTITFLIFSFLQEASVEICQDAAKFSHVKN